MSDSIEKSRHPQDAAIHFSCVVSGMVARRERPGSKGRSSEKGSATKMEHYISAS
jgi:hypothetical protein